MKELEIGDGLGSIRCFSLQHFTRSMPLEDGFGFDWGVEFGPIERKLWGVELSLVRLGLPNRTISELERSRIGYKPIRSGNRSLRTRNSFSPVYR
ncbi:hypothetical protein CsSME_00028770 [Camellia sinensis var. sinensis]